MSSWAFPFAHEGRFGYDYAAVLRYPLPRPAPVSAPRRDRMRAEFPVVENTVQGIAVPYMVWSREMLRGGRRIHEIVQRGAFTRSSTLAGRDIPLIVGHDEALVLGSTRAGTLCLRETARGLSCECSVGDGELAKTVTGAIRRRHYTGFSASFKVLDAAVYEGAGNDGQDLREIRSAHLMEISVVRLPVYETRVTISSRLRERPGRR